jgi:hypothetical protein
MKKLIKDFIIILRVQLMVNMLLVDKFLSKNFRQQSTSPTQHVVDEHFVEKFLSTKRFVNSSISSLEGENGN